MSYEDDLAFARACVRGDPGAIARLDAEIIGPAVSVARRIDRSPELATELRQRLLVRLVVGEPDRPPALESYEGRSPLAAWVRVVAARLAITMKRRERALKSDPPPAGDAHVDETMDLEREYVRHEYASAVHVAVRGALRELSEADRALLRARYIEGVSLEQLSGIHGVHRATVCRWLATVREEVLARTRGLLAASLAVTEATLDSLLRTLSDELSLTDSMLS